MNKFIVSAFVLALGVAVGGGSALGTKILLEGGGPDLFADNMVFVPTGTILAPLVFGDGRLAGYVSIDAQIEVASGQSEAVTTKLPILLNAVNMRTYRKPLASGRDGMIPNLDAFRKVLMEAANETYGDGVVTRVMVTQAAPV